MSKDPVLRALSEYKEKHTNDVIRQEYAIYAEIARCQQYEKLTKYPELTSAIIAGLETSLQNLRELRGVYLNLRFQEYVRRLPWYKRRAAKSNPAEWKYTYYRVERTNAVREVLEVIDQSRHDLPVFSPTIKKK